ncbi:sulfatase [Halococcus saccharolyticus]|uniref:Sulfatase n=1 Tax=Halococcus saccharolyticus DSM 5350 TaxID=1227455 RepID=M0MGE5_9EURY|nr:sulfatase [Halococcus saccharolyticus]EMA44812.1 sulfatase [Halococcus saccharolyticus DSM 5350]
MSRNIVLVTVDSLRADHCSFMGYERETTPILDAMATEGVVFENAIAPGPSTPESMPAVFTGEGIADVHHGVASRDHIRDHLSRGRTVPERLSATGYSTIGFTPNPFTSRYFGFDRGFDRFEDFLDTSARLRSAIVSRWLRGRFVAGLRFGLNLVGRGDVSMTWEDYYEELIESVAATNDPFFLWVFLLEPHWPYRPPDRHRNGISATSMYRANWTSSNFSDRTPTGESVQTVRSLYDGTIRHVDEFVRRLTDDLSEANPIYVFHADHGEAFGEHGSFGHGSHLYEENVHVPLVVWNAGVRERIEEPVSLRVLPFLLEELASSSRTLDRSRFTRPRVRTSTAQKAAVRGQDWKLLHDGAGVAFSDLVADPEELNLQSGVDLSDVWDSLESTRRLTNSERERIAGTAREIEVAEL